MLSHVLRLDDHIVCISPFKARRGILVSFAHTMGIIQIEMTQLLMCCCGYHVKEQVDGLSVFELQSLHVLPQMQQSGGGHLWGETKLKGGRSNKWNIFTLADLTSAGAEVGRVLRKLFKSSIVRVA